MKRERLWEISSFIIVLICLPLLILIGFLMMLFEKISYEVSSFILNLREEADNQYMDRRWTNEHFEITKKAERDL